MRLQSLNEYQIDLPLQQAPAVTGSVWGQRLLDDVNLQQYQQSAVSFRQHPERAAEQCERAGCARRSRRDDGLSYRSPPLSSLSVSGPRIRLPTRKEVCRIYRREDRERYA